MSYVPLHVHTECSTGFDGFQTIPELIARLKAVGQQCCAITDHGTMKGVLDFYMACKENGMKAIVGMEAYFTPDHTVKDRKFTHHLVLLAKNDIGYYNLKKLDSLSYSDGYYYYKPRIDYDALAKYHEGLICTSACMASILNGESASEWAQKYIDLFGDDFYFEIQPNDMDEQREYNDKIVALARKFNKKLIVSTDAHFACPEDEPYHALWTTLRGGDGYHDNENYLWSEDELRRTPLLPSGVIDECIATTQEIADKCDVSLEMSGNHYPVYPTDDSEKEIREICRRNWKAMVPRDKYKEYAERFEAEMKTLKQVGYLNYLLITYSILSWCKEHHIMTGMGRGSVGGCLVAYLMDIHKIDPIKYGTKFFRFVNPYKRSAADVDNDVSTRHRGEVINFIKEKYGYVSKIYTMNRLGDPDKGGVGKSAIQRAAQALRIEPSVVDDITKQVKDSIDDIATIDCPLTIDERTRLIDVSKHFYGRLEKFGIHASAVLITPDEIENYCPLEGCWSNDAGTGKREWIMAAAYDWHKLESEFGLLKEDILGLGTLDVISDTVASVKEATGKDIDINAIPLDDADVYKDYADGNTSGLFQMESNGMRRVAKELNVSCFDDITALVALFRPGPIDSGMLQQYIDGKHGKTIEYPCDVMKKYTESTYGVIVFQEQAMLIAMGMAGYNLGEADGLRKVIGRKEMTKIDAAVKDFVDSSVGNGYSQEAAESVGNQLKAAGRYIFNRCLSGREHIFRSSRKDLFVPSISEMYRIKNDFNYAVSTGHRDLRAKYRGKLGYGKGYSMCDDGKLRQNSIVDIRYSGVMPVYVVTTDSGKSVRCTMNHKLPTPKGIKLLEELSVGDELYIDGGYDKHEKTYKFYNEPAPMNAEPGHCGFTKRPMGNSVIIDNLKETMRSAQLPCEICGAPYGSGFEIHHKNQDRGDNRLRNLQWLCNSCHKKEHYRVGRTRRGFKGRPVNIEHIASIEYECDEDCYDVEMEAPNHNFVTGEGIVVCNSHSVEYGLTSYVTAWLKHHYPAFYLKSLMNSKTKQEDVLPYIEECHRLSIEILPPDYSIGNRDWTVEDNAIRCGLCYIKGVGKNLTVKPTQSWGALVAMNNKRVTENLIKAGALDYIGKSRGWMLSNLEDTKTTLKRKAQCEDRIAINKQALASATTDKERAKYIRQRDQWKAKLKAAEFTETAESSYDATAGEIEVLSFSFNALPKVLCGTAKRVTEFNDKNGHAMARIAFSTKYGEFEGVVFASAWKKAKYRDRYRGMVAGITVEQGKTYEFMMKKGVFVDVRESA